ncbi:hypothetical protein HYV79_03350 [Candidatus Woesearchaeota archaeon]|nr:hypothetical protein [Candidatus Woesearchaeota archaeon]
MPSINKLTEEELIAAYSIMLTEFVVIAGYSSTKLSLTGLQPKILEKIKESRIASQTEITPELINVCE